MDRAQTELKNSHSRFVLFHRRHQSQQYRLTKACLLNKGDVLYTDEEREMEDNEERCRRHTSHNIMDETVRLVRYL